MLAISTLQLVTALVLVSCQEAPPSPCPNIFRYKNFRGSWFGVIVRPSLPYGSRMTLKLTFSFVGTMPQGYKGDVEIVGGNDAALEKVLKQQPLTYVLAFPSNTPAASIEEIDFNGRIVCTGSPVTSDGYYTTFTTTHWFQTGNGYDTPYTDYYDTPYESPPVEKPTTTTSTTTTPPPEDYFDENESFYQVQPLTFQNNRYPFEETKPQWTNPSVKPKPTMRREPTPKPNKESLISFSRLAEVCGKASNNILYIGGSTYEKGDWPWLVAIYNTQNSGLQFRCAGTLVSERHVITAGHCTRNDSYRAIRAADLLVKVGAFNLQDWTDADMMQMGVSKVIPHPNYNGRTNYFNDIAIMVLPKDIQFTQYIMPACLWTMNSDQNEISGHTATVVGWGKDENGLISTAEPRGGEVPIVTTESCKKSSKRLEQVTSETTICAGGKDGTGPCNGDSGGGLYLHRNFRWFLRGIVSISLPGGDEVPCNLEEYVVYTDASKFMDWITSNMENT